MDFSEYVEQQAFIEFVEQTFETPQTQSAVQKPWSATKKEILGMWKNLQPNLPIYLTPIEKTGKDHSSYGEDGVRVSGSWAFIAAVVGRLKEIMSFENPETKLRLVFRGVDPSRLPNPSKQSYVFYINLERRAAKKPTKPTKPPQQPGIKQ